MNKQLILAIIVGAFIFIIGCKDDCEEPNTNCQGMYVFRDGNCQCPENSVDMGRYVCKEYSENNFWIQEGDPCLGQAYIFFGNTGKDIFDQNQQTIDMSWSIGEESGGIGGSYEKIDKIGNQYYLIYSSHNTIQHDLNEFKECVGEEYGFYDLELKIDLDWSTADVTYKFWNDSDTSIHVKKEWGPEFKAVYKSNTGPKER